MPLLLACILFLLTSSVAAGHPGKTDRHGGHRCLKECAEWDLYYSEYHLHDKNGRPIRVAVNRKPKTKRTAKPIPVPEPLTEVTPTVVPPAPLRPVAAAAVLKEEHCMSSLNGAILVLLLLWLLVRRRSAREDHIR